MPPSPRDQLDEIDVLCVCTHNRTRSVMIGGMLGRHLERAGVPARISLAGTAPDGEPAMDGAVRQLADRGVDVTAHRSRRLQDDEVAGADLILTAERDHVVHIAARWPDAFDRTFTLPEFVRRAAEQSATVDSVADFVRFAGAGRSGGLDYLDGPADDDLQDPTGAGPRQWRASAGHIDELTRAVAQALGTIVAQTSHDGPDTDLPPASSH